MPAKPKGGTSKTERPPGPDFAFRWQNFRGFEDTGWVDVRPITILIGPNNSGKTSLVRPLLLMKQTLESRDASIALKTTGPLTDVGRFNDFVFGHDSRREVVFPLRFHKPEAVSRRRRLKQILDDPPNELDVHFKSHGRSQDIQLTRFSTRDDYGRTLLTRRLLTSAGYSLDFPAKLESNFLGLARRGKPTHFLFQNYSLFNAAIEEAQSGKAVGVPGH